MTCTTKEKRCLINASRINSASETIRKASVTEEQTTLVKQQERYLSGPLPKFNQKLLPHTQFHGNRAIGC